MSDTYTEERDKRLRRTHHFREVLDSRMKEHISRKESRLITIDESLDLLRDTEEDINKGDKE